jgi:hypothetical protein
MDPSVPLKKNLNAYEEAVRLAEREDTVWYQHPNKQRKTQQRTFIPDIGGLGESEQPEEDMPFKSCVVKDPKDGEYYVFITTDMAKTARQIILAYELRPEIAEDYRQLKNCGHIEDVKSTKVPLITFHLVCTLLGSLRFHRYGGDGSREAVVRTIASGDGENLGTEAGAPGQIAMGYHSGGRFGIFAFLEFLQLYAALTPDIRLRLARVLSLV